MQIDQARMDRDQKAALAERTHRMNIRVVRPQHAALKAIADREGRTISDIMRQLIGEFLRAHDGILSEPQGD